MRHLIQRARIDHGVHLSSKENTNELFFENDASFFHRCLRRLTSLIVLISYFVTMMSQSFAMNKGIVPFAEEGTSLQFNSHLKPSSVVPLNAEEALISQQEGTQFLENGNAKEALVRATSHTFLPLEIEKAPRNLIQDEKVEEDRRVKTERDIEGGREDDNRSVHSDDSEDSPEAIAKREKILKDCEARVKDVFKKEMSYLDWALVVAPLVCTGLIVENEIYGEYRLIIDGTLNTLSLNPNWYAEIYFEYKNKRGLDTFQDTMLYNAYASLPFYLLDRVSAFFTYPGETFSNRKLGANVGYGVAALGLLGVITAAVNAGAYPAIALYSAGIGFPATEEYAKTLPPYLFAFYTVDAFLINSFWKDKLYKYLFTDRKDDEATKPVRQLLLKKMRTTKAVIASMSNEELVDLDQMMTEKLVETGSEYPSIEALKELNKIGENDNNQQRRYSVKTRNQANQTHFSMSTFVKNNWAYMLGLALVSGGAYLSFYGSEEKFANLMHTEVSWDHALPSFDFKQMGVDYAQQRSISGYHAWLDATKNVEVYNGNYTDWCWKCLDSAVFSRGNAEEGGAFFFKHCPGESYIPIYNSNPGDLGYTSDQCWGLFNFIDSTNAYWAGVSNDDYYYTPPLDPLTLTPAQQKWAVVIAVLYASVNAISAAPATKEVFKRISDSFSNHPDEILPGKRHKVWNAVTLFASTVQAFVRTAFAAAAAWYVLQSTDIDESYLWTIVGFTWVSTAMNFIIPLDDAYSKIPVRVGKSIQVGTDVASKATSVLLANPYVQRIGASLSDLTKGFRSHAVLPEVVEGRDEVIQESSLIAKLTKVVQDKATSLKQELSAAIICDEYIDRLNKMIGTIENAPKDVIHVMHQEMIS